MSLYDVLLVDQNATLDEIKLAFKRRALQVHPDKGGSKEEFHLVYQALETLADPAARQKYDHSLATTKTGPAQHAPYPKSRKRKRQDKPADPASSCKAGTKTRNKTPGKKSTSFAGKAPSKPSRATATATPAEPQSPQTKLLIKIRDLLKRLPREARNDVITNQLSQKQRVLLEKFMVDNAGTSAAQGHSEVKALAPAAGKSAPNEAGCECETSPRQTPDSSHGNCLLALPAKKRTRSSFDAICNEPATSSTMQASTPQSLTSGTSETCGTTICKKAAMDEMPGKGSNALAVPKSKPGRRPDVRMTKAKPAGKMKAKDKKAFNAKARSSCGNVKKGSHSSLYLARIRFYSLEMHTGNACDLKTALEDLMVLTAVKQKMRNQTGAGTFVERLQAAIVSSAAEHGRSLTDLKLGFHVCQSAGCFIGSHLLSPVVRSMEVFGKMRSVLEPFRQYASQIGGQTNIYWRYSPVHLEDAWKRFQSAVAQAWNIAGVDSTAILQKICSLHEARAPFRIANLQRWEQQHMARQDKNRNRPWSLRERNPSARLECWGAAANGNSRQEQTSATQFARKESYCLLGMLGAAADGNGRQEQTSTKEITKEFHSSLITCGAASDGNGRQEQTPAKKTATEVGFGQVHFRVPLCQGNCPLWVIWLRDGDTYWKENPNCWTKSVKKYFINKGLSRRRTKSSEDEWKSWSRSDIKKKNDWEESGFAGEWELTSPWMTFSAKKVSDIIESRWTF